MRIPSAVCLLAASPVLVTMAQAQTNPSTSNINRVLSFEESCFQITNSPDGKPDAAVFSLYNLQSQSRQFNWTTTSDTIAISVAYVVLYSNDMVIANYTPTGDSVSGTNGGSGITATALSTSQQLPAFSTSGLTRSLFALHARTLSDPRSVNIPISASTADNGQSGSVTIQNLTMFSNTGYVGSSMHFTVFWNSLSTNVNGYSPSRAFTVTDMASTEPGFKTLESEFESQDPAATELDPFNAFPSTTSAPGTSTSGMVAATGGTSGNIPSNGSASVHSGLSTGAVVGIAVGCAVAGLLIVGILVCFLIRRRRHTPDVSPIPYVTSNRTQELMAEKEANAGVNETPHSPYSDDGHGGEVAAAAAGVGAVAAVGTHHRQQQNGTAGQPLPYAADRSYTPYSDHPSSVPATASIQGAGATSQQEEQRHSLARSPTPQGISGRYAHLVEEGMTEDEIRRLEEEERQLDAAIEEAGRPH